VLQLSTGGGYYKNGGGIYVATRYVAGEDPVPLVAPQLDPLAMHPPAPLATCALLPAKANGHKITLDDSWDGKNRPKNKHLS
jgi:hypothetical protein